jgi:hypothetical protein
MENNEVPPNQPEQPRKSKDWIALIWNFSWDKKSLRPHIEGELHHAKQFPLLIIVVALMSILCGYYPTSCHFTHKIETIRTNYQTTNSYLAGQLSSISNELGKTQETLERKTSDDATTIADIKSDFAVKFQQKDTEIFKLTGERDAALQRSAIVEAMPGNLFNIYTNIAANAPTNLMQFAQLLSDLTNSLSQASSSDKFALFINGVEITNLSGTTVLSVPSRNVFIEVQNKGDTTANHLSIMCESTLQDTNLIRNHDWKYLGHPYAMSNTPITALDSKNTWSTISDDAIGAGNLFSAERFSISTNNLPMVIDCELSIYSEKSKTHYYKLVFLFIDLPTVLPSMSGVTFVQSQ